MKRSNNLSQNLEVLRRAKGVTQTEFAQILGVPKSTLQTVMLDGNTTLDTLIRIADGLGVTLDELVFDKSMSQRSGLASWLMNGLARFSELEPDAQGKLQHDISEILDLLSRQAEP